jgi:hypothetical protein
MLEALQIEMSEKCIEWNRRASGSQAEGKIRQILTWDCVVAKNGALNLHTLPISPTTFAKKIALLKTLWRR